MSGDNYLQAVDGTSADDIWAVGYARDLTLILHWNGTEWSIVLSPSIVNYSYFYGVAATSPNDVWAVGYHSDSIYGGCDTLECYTLIEHWDGMQWSVVPSPSVGI